MSYQVFARKYRPRSFKDVLGQDHVIQTLCNAIEQNRLAHAYLFVGPRGTGKTSTARIFAKALNCTGGPRVDFDPDEPTCLEIAEGRSLDVLEIDGASNRGIDHIRELRDNAQFRPTQGQFRIIYIDEVHMLTKESFNALLKTLEEPPSHVKFIFATTEPHKILPTILSRCQRFDLRPIPADVIASHLVHIASEEGVSLSPEAAMAIARVADGGMRDAQSMLDQLVSFCGTQIVEQHVNDVFGVTNRETVARALSYLLDRQLPSLLHLVHEVAESGSDMGQLLHELMAAVRELLVRKVVAEHAVHSIPEAWLATLEQLMERTPADKLIRVMELLAITEERLRWSSNKRLHLEMGLIQSVHCLAEANISDIVRALQGAELPETPIATTRLPDVAYPSVQVKVASVVEAAPVVEAVPVVEATPTMHAYDEPVSLRMPVDDALDMPLGGGHDEMFGMDLRQPEPAPVPAPTPPPVAVSQQAPRVERRLEPIDDAPPSFISPPPTMPMMEQIAKRDLDASVWSECLELYERRFPLQFAIMELAHFAGCVQGEINFAVHPDNRMLRDALLDADSQSALLDILEELCGQRFRVRVHADEAMPLPSEADVSERMPLPEIEEIAPPKPVVPPPTTPAIDPAIEEARLQREKDFYDDPLILDALKQFHARIIQ